MKKSYGRYRWHTVGLLVLIFSLSLVHFLGADFLGQGLAHAKITPNTFVTEPVVLDPSNSQVRAVMAAQDRHTPYLMDLPEVVGTATGLTEDGRPAILVFTHTEVGPMVPENIEGIPIRVKTSGKIFAMPRSTGGGGSKIDQTTSELARPVPIGVSTGNQNECSAGTISARVKNASGVYALSNNHVYALENTAALGSSLLQPGLYETGCILNSSDSIGTLYAFKPIVFSPKASNTIDAAIAATSSNLLDNATPADGYGIPNSAIARAKIGMSVQKYGRTTLLTTGTVTGINAKVKVQYRSGTARFIKQIVITSTAPFIQPGDSGSLLVTNNPQSSEQDAHPVGLLFAGNTSGTYAVANPIGAVLNYFGVTIDGK